MRVNKLVALFIPLFFLSFSMHAAAQGSKRPLRLVVVSPPGGPSDVQTRLLVARMSEALGQTVIVDNRPSNNGVVGSEIGARAAPDGYTITVGNSGTHAVNATLYQKLPYDPIKDFEPISQFATTGLLVAANPRLPAANLSELAAYARKEPGKVNIGIPGATGQMAGDALWSAMGVKMNNVNYKGSAPSELALLSGEVDIVFLTPLAGHNHMQTGKLKALAISSAQRNPLLPQIPTAMEQGIAGYDFQYWNGMFAPAKTSPAIIQSMHKAIIFALQSPEVKDRFTQLGLSIVGNSPKEFAVVLKNDIERFRKVIIEQNIPRM